MAMNPFEQYGIKEVADVIIYDISSGTPVPAMYFDTLKLSNIETTAERTEAKGGKGNPKLISWDYGREITLTLQDALFSVKSLELMTAGQNPKSQGTKIRKAKIATVGEDEKIDVGDTSATNLYVLETEEALTGTGGVFTSVKATEGQIVRVVYETAGKAGETYEIVITPERFPGIYMLVGDTVIRNKKSGKDEGFQFIIPKAKFGSAVSFTMEAEGDPSVFDIEIDVLKADNGTMMSLVRYEMASGGEGSVASNLT